MENTNFANLQGVGTYLDEDVPKLNENFAKIDALLEQASNERQAEQATREQAVQALQQTQSQVGVQLEELSTQAAAQEQNLALQGQALQQFTEDVEIKISVIVFPGMILPFCGTFGGSDGKRPIPLGSSQACEDWALCDGSNNTPNLVHMCIVGGDGLSQGMEGGDVVTEGHTLTESETPYHEHVIELYTPSSSGSSRNVACSGSSVGKGDGKTEDSDSFRSSWGHAHSHNQNLPPHYKFSYIMKLGGTYTEEILSVSYDSINPTEVQENSRLFVNFASIMQDENIEWAQVYVFDAEGATLTACKVYYDNYYSNDVNKVSTIPSFAYSVQQGYQVYFELNNRSSSTEKDYITAQQYITLTSRKWS